jgi:hypothetical protein
VDRKAFSGDRKRFAAEQRIVTPAAFRLASRLACGNTIDGIAMRANDIPTLSAHGFWLLYLKRFTLMGNRKRCADSHQRHLREVNRILLPRN